MSKEIDDRVVEMRFDNEHFEKNVQTSMSTLDKFKRKLQFKNAGKGFDDIDKAAKKTDLSPLAKSADKVGLRFNAMYTMADQAFRNITNSAMAAGKRIVNALTIDPVKTGLSEYETKMNAVQVIQANTRGKNTMEDITAALEDLNTYADKTIYNFAQMTSNVGKFTAQGYKVEDAANAVKGLANLAAASGASAEDMARATYQMSQALGGTIRLMDWNSLRNANMATVDLKNTLIDLAKVNGIAIDSMIEKHGTFEQTLSEGWLSGDMFTEAMNIYSGIYSEAELKAKGFTDAQIENFMGLAKMAESAATEVKTFTQLFDVLKETAQSGWTQTWEIIFGDFDTAKKMFTDLQVYFGDIINAFSDARNMLLGGALNLKNPWSKIYEKLEASSFGKVISTFDKVSNSVKDAADKVEYFQKIVNDVWRGDYKNSDTGRYELLEAAGYNHKVVQDLVNKGYNYKLTIEDIEESHKKFGLTLDGNAASMAATGDATEGVTVKFNELTDAQLKQAGLTKEEIKLYRALAEEADRTGVTMLHLVEEMSTNDGRTMLIESAKNAWLGLVSILQAVRDAWVDIFPPMTVVQLYNIIKGIREFSEYLVVHTETQENLTRTLKGVFAILDIILTLVSLPMKIAFKALTSLLGVLDVDILSLTAKIGDVLVKFRDWIDTALDFTSVWKKIIPPIKDAMKAFSGWIDTLKESEDLPKDIAKGIITWFKKAFDTVKGWFGNLGSLLQNGFSGASDNVIVGLVQGLWNGLKVAGQVVVELGKTLINKFCEILGIHSPSVVFYAIGGFIISGLLLGIKAFFPEVWSTISGYALKCVDVVKEIDWGSVFSAITSAVTTIALYKVSDAIQNFSKMFDGLNEMLVDVGQGVEKALKGLGSALKGIGASFRAKAMKDIAIAILILVGAVVALSFVPEDKLWSAVGAIAALGVVLAILFAVVSATTKGQNNKETFVKVGAMILTMIGVAASILILAKALEAVANVDFKSNGVSVLLGIVAIVSMIGLVLAELVFATKFIKGVDFGKLALTVTAIAGLMLTMAIVMKILGGLAPQEFGKGLALVTSFGAIAAALVVMSTKNTSTKVAQTGSLVKRVGEAMLFMAIACKIIGTMSWGEIGKAAVGVLGFAGIIAGLIAISKIGTDKDIANVGKVLSGAGAAMLLMVLAGKIINSMTWSEMWQAMVGIAALSAIISGLILATRMASGKDLAKIGTTLLMLSISIGVLALIASLLSFMDTEALKKGVGAVSALGLIMAAMIFATSKAQNVMGNLIVMTIAITLMATAVATLSLIDTTSVLTSAGAMVAMMSMFALMIASTKFINEKALVPLITLTAIVTILAGIVAGLSFINGEKALVSTMSLIVLMGAMTALLLIISKASINLGNALVGIIGLTIMAGEIVLFGGALALVSAFTFDYKKIETVMNAVTIMGVLLVACAGIGFLFAALSWAMIAGLAGLTIMAGEIVLFGGALALVSIFKFDSKKIDPIINVMEKMGELMVKISLYGPLALIAVGALSGLLMLMGSLGTLGVILTKLDIWDDLQDFVDKGIPVLEQLSLGLGSIISNFVTGLLSGLPAVGTILSDFMEEAQGFITGIKMVDGEVLKGIGILVASFTTLCGMNYISALGKIFSGGKSPFASFSEGLSDLAECITDFADSLGSFTDDQLKAVKRGAEALKVIAQAAAAIPNTGGWAGDIMGENDLDDFIKMVVGNPDKNKAGVKELVECLSGLDLSKDQLKVIERVADVIVAIADAAAAIPNTGGWAGVFAGNNDLDDFIKMVVGSDKKKGVKDLVDSLKTIEVDKDQLTKIDSIVGIMVDLADAAASIPNIGGEVSFWAGDNRIDSFMLMVMGDGENYGIKALIDCMADIELDEATGDKILDIVDIIQKLAIAANNVPDTGAFSGNDSIKKFIKMLAGSIENLKDFIETAGDLEYSDEISNVVTLIRDITSINNNIGKNSGKNLKSFSKNLVTFANKFKDFSDKMAKIKADSVASAISKMKELVTLCQSFTANSADSLTALGDALKDVAKGGIKNFTKAFTSDTSAKKAINKFIEAAAKGAKTKKNKEKFAAVGKYLMEGFASGIKNNQSKVTTAAKNAAKAAYKAAEKELDINSPSKKFMQIGGYVDEGLAKGIDDNTSVVEESTKELTDTLLTTAQEELDINSPSLVFKEGVGKYIVEGIADGITEDMSAEEALNQKLSNMYQAMLDWNKNHPMEVPLTFSDIMIGQEFSTSTVNQAAKDSGYDTTTEYLEDQAETAYLESIAKNERDKIEARYEARVNKLEGQLEDEDVDYDWKKFTGIFKDQTAKDQAELDHLKKRSEILNDLIALNNEKLLAYQTETNIQSDDYTRELKTRNNEWYELLGDHQARVDELNQSINESAANADLEVSEIKISPPTLEYSKELGHHIVKNIAYGITEDMSAEEAVEKKAQNINNAFQEAYSDLSTTQEKYDVEYENWELLNPDAKQSTKDTKLLGKLKQDLSVLKTTEQYHLDQWKETKRIMGESSDEANEAYNAYKKAENARISKETEIKDTRNEMVERDQQEQEEYAERREAALDERREAEYELWVARNQNASEEEKRERKIAYLEEKRVDAAEEYNALKKEYATILKKNNNVYTPEVNEARAAAQRAETELANIENDIADTQKEALDAIEEQRSIAYNVAKLKYDIWEKTSGRDADDAEKEAKQLEYLNEQLSIQNVFTTEALNDYNKALTDFGSGSVEATRAYKNYLDEVYAIADLKSQILDLEESAADRQKRLREEQDLAQRDYENYIKKYEKFYLQNGMSRADLERDAKLVSGYNPTKVVDKITTETKTALESVTTSVSYQNILTGFTDMGTSYVQALNEGVNESSATIQNTASEMVAQCAEKLVEKRPLWVLAGKQLVQGLIQGVKSQQVNAITAAFNVANDMLTAAKLALDIHSPSKAFANVGKYAILGLVKGLVDNTGLSDDAAAHMGDSAIESLKNSIRQISDVVNSDLDTQPTIRPVLDLSNIRSGTARLNAMVSNAQAIAISESRKSRERSDENQNGNEQSTNKGNTYQFTQNNYSPKALSRTEIYRQTKNQFAAMKEVLT